jgi:hypothetical protein
MFWSPDHAGSYGVQTRYEPCYRLWIVHLKASFVLFRAVGGTNLPLNDTLVHQSTGSIVQADSPIVKALELCPNSRYVKGALSFGDDYYWNRRMAKSSRICIRFELGLTVNQKQKDIYKQRTKEVNQEPLTSLYEDRQALEKSAEKGWRHGGSKPTRIGQLYLQNWASAATSRQKIGLCDRSSHSASGAFLLH